MAMQRPEEVVGSPGTGVRGNCEYKKKGNQPSVGVLCSEVKREGRELLLPSRLPHHGGWKPQTLSQIVFLIEMLLVQ